MKAATAARKVQLISPKELGIPLKRFKTERNKLCYCGSGLKQKKCHSDRERFE